MAEIVQEIMQKHAEGISFRERNAGHQIDEKMQDQVRPRSLLPLLLFFYPHPLLFLLSNRLLSFNSLYSRFPHFVFFPSRFLSLTSGIQGLQCIYEARSIYRIHHGRFTSQLRHMDG